MGAGETWWHEWNIEYQNDNNDDGDDDADDDDDNNVNV